MELFSVTVAEYKLTDLLSSAGATIGVIIAGTIFLQFLSTKYTELAGRYREIATEYRGVDDAHGRHGPLRSQIRGYRRRLVLLNRASWLGALALLNFLLAVLAGGLSIAFPPIRIFKVLGTFGLSAGLLLIAAAVTLELLESIMARKEIWEEIADLDEEATRWSRDIEEIGVQLSATRRRIRGAFDEERPGGMSDVSKRMNSPVGKLTLIGGDAGLAAILWEDDDPRRVRIEATSEDDHHPVLVEAERQLTEYFAGDRREFTVKLDYRGTPFQKQVWQALLEIPFGETRTYGELARHIGNPAAVRAVGAANGKNPISIIGPCHRVIGASGQLTGFAGGLDVKATLLRLEGNELGGMTLKRAATRVIS